MNRPTFWILNPLHKEYNNFPKKILCTSCEYAEKYKIRNKHNVNIILYNEDEKRYHYNLRTKQLINKCKN